MLTDSASIVSFAGREAAGNRHDIVVFKDDLPELSPGGGKVVAVNDSAGELRVRFFDNGHRVLRCGSGCVALATYLRRQPGQECFAHKIRTDAGPAFIGHDKHGPYYRDRPLAQRPLSPAFLWRWLCSAPVARGALVGSASDYAIVELARREQLLGLRPQSRRFGLFTGRALIALCFDQGEVGMRYFAPQYGVQEDLATGSAAVQAARYGLRTYSLRRLGITQFAGGISGRIETRVLPGGDVQVRGDDSDIITESE